MSLQDKQQLLRCQIVEKGEDPQKFYEFWQQYNLELDNAQIQTIQRIIEQFKQHQADQKNKQQAPKQQQQDDQFGEYIQPVKVENSSNFYDNVNWDFLAQKPTNNNKPQKIETTPSKLLDYSSQKKKKEKSSKEIQQQSLSFEQRTNKQKTLLQQTESIQNQKKDINNVTFREVLKEAEAQKRKCLKLQPNILQHHVNVEINIVKFQQKEAQNSGLINKLWKGTNFLFTIKTIGRNKQKAIGISWQVKRMHSDFQWLRNMLVKMYPGHVVPPLPNPTKDIHQMNGYQRKLESFLYDCYRCPELRNSKYFQVFLSYAKQFENFKKTSENSSKPKDISHILNVNGQIELLYGSKIDEYSDGLQNFLNKSSVHLKNVRNVIQQINVLYDDISSKYKQLSDIFIVMSSQSCNFSEDQCFPKLTDTYSQISNLITQHSEFCLNQKDFVETFMHSHFAYQKDRIDNMQTLITKRKTYTSEFFKPKHQNGNKVEATGSMLSKISGFFGEKTQSVDIPSANTQTLKDQVGFFNSQLMKESIRCIQGMINSHINHFSMYGHSRIDNVDNMQNIWSTVLVELSKLNMK